MEFKTLMRCKKASALLLVLIITSALTLLSFSCWYKSSLLLDLVLQREIYYKHFYLTESCLHYGCSLAKNNFTTYPGKEKIIDLDFLLEELNLDKTYDGLHAKVCIKKITDPQLLITAILEKNKQEICRLSCNLLRSGKDSENNKLFVVQNFSIGSAP